MKSKTEAIILGSVNLGEADKLVTFLSPARGRLSGVAKNARKSFRRFGAGLEMFTHSMLVLYEREHQHIVRIESADIIHQASGISSDLSRLAAGAVMIELVREMTPEGDPVCAEPAFRLLSDSIRLLSEAEDPMFLLRIFEIKFFSILGYQPKLDRCFSCGRYGEGEMIFHAMKGGVLCPSCMVSSGESEIRLSAGTVGFYYQALRMEMDKVERLRPSAYIMRELDQALGVHTLHILGKRLRSAEFLMTVQALG